MVDLRQGRYSIVDPFAPWLRLVDPEGKPTPQFVALWDKLVQSSINLSAAAHTLIGLLDKRVDGARGQIQGGAALGAPGNITLQLTPTGVVPGTVCSDSQIPCLTVDVYGRVLSISTIALGQVDLKDTTGLLPVSRLEGLIQSGQLAPDSVTARELDIPAPARAGSLLVGAHGNGFQWLDPARLTDTGGLDYTGAIYTSSAQTTGAPFRYAFSSMLPGGPASLSLDSGGYITIHDAHHTRFLLVVVMELQPDTALITTHSVINLALQIQRGPDTLWRDITPGSVPATYVREAPCGAHRVVGVVVFHVKQGTHAKLRVLPTLTSSVADEAWNLPGAQTWALVQPLESKGHLDSATLRTFEHLTDTDIKLSAHKLGLDLISLYPGALELDSEFALERLPGDATMLNDAYYWSDTRATISKRKGSPDVLFHAANQMVGLMLIDAAVVPELRNTMIQIVTDTHLVNTSFAKLNVVGLQHVESGRFTWPPWWYDRGDWLLNAGWASLGEYFINEGNTATDVTLPDIAFEALAVVLRVSADVNVPVSGLVLRKFVWGLPVARDIQVAEVRDTVPFNYMLHTGVARQNLRGVSTTTSWGCPPVSVGTIDYASGQASVRFHQDTDIAIVNLSGAGVAGFWENPYTKFRSPISSASFHQSRVRALSGDTLAGLTHNQLLQCSTRAVYRLPLPLGGRVRYLMYFNEAWQTDADFRDRLDRKAWLETAEDDVVTIQAPVSPSRVYLVVPAEGSNPATYSFRRHPRGLWESWSEVDTLQGRGVRVFRCPSVLFETRYAVRVAQAV